MLACLRLAQLLISDKGSSPGRSLLVLTRAAQASRPMAGGVARPSHGGCWGVSRVLRLEHPGLRVISADAPPSNPTRTPTLTPNPTPPFTVPLNLSPTRTVTPNPNPAPTPIPIPKQADAPHGVLPAGAPTPIPNALAAAALAVTSEPELVASGQSWC